MRPTLALLVSALALIASACAQSTETVAPGQEPTSTTSTDDTDPADTDPADTDPGDTDPDAVTRTIDDVLEPLPWREQPMARVVLTENDFESLGLGTGWQVDRIDYSDIEPGSQTPDGSGDLCGTPSPDQSSFFQSAFEDTDLGREIGLIIMPRITGSTIPSDFLDFVELLASCEERSGLWAGIRLELVAAEIDGSDRSVVVTGQDASLPTSTTGMTIAGAVADGHLFLAMVSHDSGTPADDDVDLAIATVELSISRL